MVFISPPPLLHHCTGLESANCLLEYIATISFYGKPTPKMICLNYKLQARRSGSSHTNLQNHVAKNGNPPPPIIRCERAPGNEQHHHPSQGVVEGPPRQAGHAGHLQHHGVSTALSNLCAVCCAYLRLFNFDIEIVKSLRTHFSYLDWWRQLV